MFTLVNKPAKTYHVSIAVEIDGSVVHKYSPIILLYCLSSDIISSFISSYNCLSLSLLQAQSCDLNSRILNLVVIRQNFFFFYDNSAQLESGNF
jgi:hypothetical protein